MILSHSYHFFLSLKLERPQANCVHLCFFAPTEAPSEPRSASVYFVNESSAVLIWQLPEITGTPINVSYDVNCLRSCEYYGSDCDDQTCNSDIDGQLKAEGIKTTIFTATNLAPFINYTCKITAKNRVSKMAELKTRATDGERTAGFTYVNLTTKGSGKLVESVSDIFMASLLPSIDRFY